MLKKLLKSKQGFTIIEVLIVMAIAGLILLIVFLAVPALQRNSRNTQRHNDVANVLGIFAEYSNNQNGLLPTKICWDSATQVLSVGGGSGACTTAPTNAATVSLSGQFSTYSITALPSPVPTSATANTLVIYTSATCNGNALTGGTGRAIAAWYQIEPTVNQCKTS